MKTINKTKIIKTKPIVEVKRGRGRPKGAIAKRIGIRLEDLNKVFKPDSVILIHAKMLEIIKLQNIQATPIEQLAAVEKPLEVSVIDFDNAG